MDFFQINAKIECFEQDEIEMGASWDLKKQFLRFF
jgi:hypothetical protein